MTYYLIAALLVALNAIAALWTAAGIKRQRREYKAAADARKSSPRGPDSAKKGRSERVGQKGVRLTEDSPDLPGKRWKLILLYSFPSGPSDYIFSRSLGIGRAARSDAFEEFCSIPGDKKVSKIHCSISAGSDRLYLRDEGSTNHTYLNGKKIKGPVTIKKGDVISVGETDICVSNILREV